MAKTRLVALKLALVAALPGMAGLLAYASSRAWWIGSDDRGVAIAAALLLGAGALAALRGRVLGLLLMLPAGSAALGLAIETAFRLQNPLRGGCSLADDLLLRIALVAVVPAALLAIVAVAGFVGPMLRFVRRRS